MSGKNKATRWGIIGAGEISHDWAVAVATLPKNEHEIVAVAARAVDRAKKFAQVHNIPKVHNTYEDLIKDGDVGKLSSDEC